MNARASSARTAWNAGLTFNLRALLITIALFCVELSIATVFRHIGWLRGFVGDALAVVFVYYGFKSFVRAPVLWLATAALLVGYGVELSQYVAQSAGWRISNPVLRIVVGSTPDWWDVVAYTVGFIAILFIERWASRRGRTWSVAS
jgi:Protein of unknown function (DUF2809)